MTRFNSDSLKLKINNAYSSCVLTTCKVKDGDQVWCSLHGKHEQEGHRWIRPQQ